MRDPADRGPESISRRAVLRSVGQAACAMAPLAAFTASPATASACPLAAAALFAALDELSGALVRAEIDGVDWQRRALELIARADVAALRAAITLDWSSIATQTRERGRSEHGLEASELRGGPSAPRFRRKLYSLARGHAILPHGHRHIVSAFVVLDGRVRGRHYDRVRDEPHAILIRPTDDRSFAPGDCAAISDQVDNVHWFTALDDQAALFNVSATVPERFRLQAGATGRVYLDPDGEALDGGLIRAPRASVAALRAKYEG